MFVNKSTESMEIKLVDFGFSCLADPKDGLDRYSGSPAFMAPEIVKREVYDYRVDIWATAAIAYVLLSGSIAFLNNGVDALLMNI